MTITQNKIVELERLTYVEKLRHWGEEDEPWTPSHGRQYRFAKVNLGERLAGMIGGDVKSSPAVIGRPCYGILTAYLRYRDATKYVKNLGLKPTGRCHDCGAKIQCADIVKRRIRAQPEIEHAYQAWMLEDGPREINKPGWRTRRSGKLWQRLCWAAIAHPFTSVNDQRVADHYAQIAAANAKRERERQARNRERLRKEGQIDPAHVADIERAMLLRASRVVRAVNHAREHGGSRILMKIPNESVRELIDVWLGQELLRARKQKPRAASIARWIIETGRSNRCVDEGALAVRVRRDLKRIKDLEALTFEGEPILTRFDPATEFTTAGA